MQRWMAKISRKSSIQTLLLLTPSAVSSKVSN
jgi:hypothetical protein